MNKTKISVIVPVYDVEPYLEKCVDSLLAQDFGEPYDIILVDDGSPDNCPAICDAYAEKHPDKVSVIHKPNGGLSDARNKGVEASEAEYVCFVDSDDHVAENHLSSLYGALVRERADMAVSPFLFEKAEADGSFSHRNPLQELPCTRLTRDEALVELCLEKHFSGFAWSKLMRRRIAAAHPFPVGHIFEDTATVYKQILDCETVAYTPTPTYYYLQRSGSILRRRFSDKHLELIYFSGEMLDRFEREGLPKAVKDAGAYKLCRACYVSLFHAGRTLSMAEFLEAYRKLSPYYERALPVASRHPTVTAWNRFMFHVARHPRLMYTLIRLQRH